MNTMKCYISLAVFLLIIAILLLVKYLNYRALYHEWIVVYPGQENVFVEYRVSLFDLREILSEGHLTLEQAVSEIGRAHV